jgi:hypothetical protein
MAWTALAWSPGALLAQPAPATPPKVEAKGPEAPLDEVQARAAARKKAGDAAMEALQYADALAAYSDAHAITRDPALLYNMGRALQALNRFPEALDKLDAFDLAASPELKARVPRLPKLIAEIRQRVSELRVVTNIEGARILVRSTVVGKSPLPGPLRLAAGPAEIEIEAEGYFPARKSVELPGGGELRVDLDLFSRATTGVLQVKASAPGAEVLIDERRIGVAPVELNVTKGTHRIAVRHPDFRLYETSAVVLAGESKSVLATLQTKPIVTRWWFWTGVAAVAAAGAVATVAAVTERGPDSGTIAPGQLSTASHGGVALFHF